MSDIDVLIDTLIEVEDFIDRYVDVNDGPDGQPVPNRAMALNVRVAEVIARLQAGRQEVQ